MNVFVTDQATLNHTIPLLGCRMSPQNFKKVLETANCKALLNNEPVASILKEAYPVLKEPCNISTILSSFVTDPADTIAIYITTGKLAYTEVESMQCLTLDDSVTPEIVDGDLAKDYGVQIYALFVKETDHEFMGTITPTASTYTSFFRDEVASFIPGYKIS